MANNTNILIAFILVWVASAITVLGLIAPGWFVSAGVNIGLFYACGGGSCEGIINSVSDAWFAASIIWILAVFPIGACAIEATRMWTKEKPFSLQLPITLGISAGIMLLSVIIFTAANAESTGPLSNFGWLFYFAWFSIGMVVAAAVLYGVYGKQGTPASDTVHPVVQITTVGGNSYTGTDNQTAQVTVITPAENPES